MSTRTRSWRRLHPAVRVVIVLVALVARWFENDAQAAAAELRQRIEVRA